jgi:phosphoglycolate phosphatase
MPYQAILFDLDGTLLDTLEDLADAMNRVLAGKGFPTHELDAYRYFIGDGAAMLVTRVLPEAARSDALIQTCLAEFRQDYGENWRVKTQAYDGVQEMLDKLTARGLPMAVLSNKPQAFTRRYVSELLADWRFDVVLGQREGVPRKPDPAGALEIAELLNIAPADFLFLGDTAGDIKTAVAAGMYPVGVLWGFRPAEELLDGGAQALIARPLEILELLD